MKEKKEKKPKQPLTAEQIYKSNRHKSKLFKALSPVMFWLFMALAVIFFCLTIRNSVGNVIEITSLLDSDTYTGEQVSENYQALIDKYGEWVIIESGNGAVTVRFVDVRKALFSGLALTFGILTIVSLAAAVVVGKVVFNRLSKMYEDSNDVMVDMATLKTLESVEKSKEQENKKKGWF